MESSRHRWIKLALTALYYFAVILGLLAIYSSGLFKTPAFIYQGF